MATTTQSRSQSPQNRNQNQGQNQPQSDDNQTHGNHGPVESFRLNNVTIAVFENESEHEGRKSRYYRAKIDKRYLDQKSGEWKSTSSYSLDELLRLQHLIGDAVGFMAQKPGDPNSD